MECVVISLAPDRKIAVYCALVMSDFRQGPAIVEQTQRTSEAETVRRDSRDANSSNEDLRMLRDSMSDRV